MYIFKSTSLTVRFIECPPTVFLALQNQDKQTTFILCLDLCATVQPSARRLSLDYAHSFARRKSSLRIVGNAHSSLVGLPSSNASIRLFSRTDGRLHENTRFWRSKNSVKYLTTKHLTYFSHAPFRHHLAKIGY